MRVSLFWLVVAMTLSKKAAYVANGADLDQPFENNELLHQKDDFPFEDPPWRVLDTVAVFEPMEIGSASAATTESLDIIDDEPESDSTNNASQDSDSGAEICPEGPEAEIDIETISEVEALPTAVALTEKEVMVRVAEAVTAKEAELIEKFEPRIKELENQLFEAQARVEETRVEVRDAIEKEFQAQLEANRKTYDGLTQKLALASDVAKRWLEDKPPRRVIVVPGKLVNLVPS